MQLKMQLPINSQVAVKAGQQPQWWEAQQSAAGLTLTSRQHRSRCASCRNFDIKRRCSVTYLQSSFCDRRHNNPLHHQGIQAAHSARLSALLLICAHLT